MFVNPVTYGIAFGTAILVLPAALIYFTKLVSSVHLPVAPNQNRRPNTLTRHVLIYK